MNRRFNLLCMTVLVAAASADKAPAQEPLDAVKVQAAVVRAVRASAPPVPYLLVHDAGTDASLTQRVGMLVGLGVRAISDSRTTTVVGGDTVAMRIRVDSLSASKAFVTVETSGRLSYTSAYGPKVWFERQCAELVRESGVWVVRRLRTMFVS